MFALASVHATNGKSQHYMDVAKNITRTCHESYIQTGQLVRFMEYWYYNALNNNVFYFVFFFFDSN